MKLIKPSFEIIEQLPGLKGIYKQIELAGRTCYKSFDKITEDSAEPFVNRMMSNHHLSVLEHGTVYLKVDSLKDKDDYRDIYDKYKANPYSKVLVARGFMSNRLYITSNYRVLVEHNWLDDLKYLCEPTESHEPRISVKFICSRSISHELVRHRVFSFIQESQRYVGYNKSKFGGEITYIIPSWSKLEEGSWKPLAEEEEIKLYRASKDKIQFDKDIRFSNSLFWNEVTYMDLISNGCKPQEAREVLPNATKTEIIMTGFLSDWVGDEEKKKGFFPLRCDSAAHPDMRALAIPLREEFIKKGWMNG